MQAVMGQDELLGHLDRGLLGALTDRVGGANNQ
jgi:hypothetical protein